MIHGVLANRESFHPVTFTAGLNVVLAERAEASTERDTRNGVGKTLLIEIIDFCLGSGATQGKGLLIEPLNGWVFSLDITLGGNRVVVSRAVSAPSRVIVDGPTNGWPDQPDRDDSTGERVLKVDRWRTLLGQVLFVIPCLADERSYKPSYRSLVSYFIRLGADAYTSPFRHFRNQNTWDTQLHVAYLLGMNWEYAARWQELKDKEEGIKALKKAIKTGVIKGAVGTIGTLETQRIQLEQETLVARQALDSFKVHPQYESLQRDADSLTKDIHDAVNGNVASRRLLARYEESLKEERPPAAMSLERLYEDSGLIFPEAVVRTLAEARSFHIALISNRREFVEAEITRIRRSIDMREERIRSLTERRAEVMEVLQSHGALREMTALQRRHVLLQGALDEVQNRLRDMKNLKATVREVKVAKEELLQMAERDHEQRRELWSAAVRLVNEHSQALYGTLGKLVIDVWDTGYRFRVDIERSGSEGIDKMKIFCFDLAVLQLQTETSRGMDFLIHDTVMYDSVDTRQRAKALERAHEMTSLLGMQYICTMNSDMVPAGDFSEGFDFQQCIRITLSDSAPSESLLGVRFERPEK